MRRLCPGNALYAAVIGLVLLVFAACAQAAERVALVIGNSDYANAERLANPRNDAADVARVLRETMGFDAVLERTDLDHAGMIDALVEFSNHARGAEVALVYYAGHGLEFGKTNYLLPVDAPKLEYEVQLSQLLDVDHMLRATSVARVSIVFLDACRDNPFEAQLRQALDGSTRSADVGRGLGKIDQAPGQSLVVYATAAGATAADGTGRNSPFTQAVLRHLATPGLDVRVLVGRIRDEVIALTQPTGRIQRPYEYSSLGGDPIFLAGAAASTPGPVIDPIPPMRHVELTVRPTPADARVRIMNIAPVYRDGIVLEVGEEYDIEVSAPGYETYRRRQSFEAGRRELTVALTPITQRILVHGDAVRDRLEDGSLGPEMVFLRGGSFQMGSPESEAGRFENERQHSKVVSDVLIARTETTVEEFRRFIESSGYHTDAERNAGGEYGCYGQVSNGDWGWVPGRNWRSPGFSQGNDEPVVCVSWNDAQAYVAWLSLQTGENYRLPTEAEWEYAARAGTNGSRSWGDDPNRTCDHANMADISGQRQFGLTGVHECDDGYGWTAPVSSYLANPWGLSDMQGNVWEWTCSGYDEAYGGAEDRCDFGGENRAARGGAWNNRPAWARAATRDGGATTHRHVVMGFRPARSP